MDDTPIPSTTAGVYQLPVYPGGHYFARPRTHQWGRTSMMLFLTDLSIAWHASAKSVYPIGIGDISFENGDPPPKHKTHKWWCCVDIYILHKHGAKRSDTSNKITFADKEYDPEATKELAILIAKIIKRGYQCVQFLYDDPDVKAVWPAKITTSKERPHLDHFHIQLNDPTPYAGKEKEILSMPMSERHPKS